MTQTDMIDLKTGYPDESLVPRETIARLAAEVLHSGRGFQYAGDIAGSLHTREQLAHWLTTLYGQRVSASELVVTTGALHGIDISCRALTLPGDVVVVESPTFYYGMTIIQANHVQIIGVSMTPDGIDLDALEGVCRQYGSRVKVVYTIPAFHNPTGINASIATRHGLIALAQRYHFTILEDVTYQPLYFDEPPPPIIRTLENAHRVVTIASVSKLLMPAIRIGWILSTPDMLERLKTYKGDGGTSMFNSEIVAQYLESGAFDAQVNHARQLYAKRHDAMVKALKTCAPAWLMWQTPNGGYFIWATLPEGKSCKKLHDLCTAHGVDFFVGAASYTNGQDDRHFRLCFAYSNEADIERGITILGECLHRLD